MEDAVGILQGLLITAVISLLFFRSIYGAVSGVLILPFWLRQYRNELHQKRRADMENEFKEYTMMIASLLDAGYSLERALRQSEVELVKLFGGGSVMAGFVHEMNQKIAMNVQVERAFEEMAERLELQEAVNLSDILVFSKRSGGDYGRYIKDTAYKIEDKIMVQQEINTMTVEKRFEYRIMSVMPIGILAYVSLTSKEFIDPLYSTIAGRIVMSVSLVLYGILLVAGKKIVEIEI